MDVIEREVVQLRAQIKQNLTRLVNNTQWNKSLDKLVISNGVFEAKDLEILKKHRNPIEQFYNGIYERGYCYKPSDVITVLNTLVIALKESDNADAAKTLNSMIQKTSIDLIGLYENPNMQDLKEENYVVPRYNYGPNADSKNPTWNDAVDWKILGGKIVWNKKLEGKLLAYQLLDSDVLHHTGFPKEKTANLSQRVRKISYKQIPNKNFKQLYDILVKVLVESGNYRAASILDLSGSIREISSIKKKPSGRLHNPTGRSLSPNPNRVIELSMPVPPNSPLPQRSLDLDDGFPTPRPPLHIEVKKAATFMIPPVNSTCYPMSSKPRGSVLIINNEYFEDPAGLYKNRYGSTIDANNLSILFEQLDFKCTIKDNRTYKQMRDDIYTFSKLTESVEPNMRILVVLSHGDKTNVLSANGFKLPYEWITSQFNNYSCPQLRGKPKLFIFPACRGSTSDHGVDEDLNAHSTQVDSLASDALVVMMPSSPSVSRSGKRLPMYGDMLIAYGTVPGYVSNRDTLHGSWYIQCLCTVFMEKSCEMELMEMLAEISQEMLKYESEFGTVQTSSYEVRGCFNKLYFNPGL